MPCGANFRIDAHDSPVRPGVWALYRETIRRIGPMPTLIEWDNDVPDWATLYAEARRADAEARAATQAEFADVV